MLRIKEIRKSKKITAKELANFVNVAESTMSLYENGKREPDFKTLCLIAEYLDVSVDYLLGNESSVSSPAPEEPQLSEREKLLLSIFRNLPEDVQTAYIDQGRVYEDILKKD